MKHRALKQAAVARAEAGESAAEAARDLKRRDRFLLADRLGMASYQHSADIAGHLIASGAGFATLRDQAKIGVPARQDAVWNGERPLPPGWVDYAMTPTVPAPATRRASAPTSTACSRICRRRLPGHLARRTSASLILRRLRLRPIA